MRPVSFDYTLYESLTVEAFRATSDRASDVCYERNITRLDIFGKFVWRLLAVVENNLAARTAIPVTFIIIHFIFHYSNYYLFLFYFIFSIFIYLLT